MKTIGNSKEVEICGKKITVKKLSLRKIISLIKQLKSFPKEITMIDEMKSDEIMEKLPMLLATILPSIAGIVVEAVGEDQISEDFLLDECGIDDNLDLINALLEVNNLGKIFLTIKSIKGLVKSKK